MKANRARSSLTINKWAETGDANEDGAYGLRVKGTLNVQDVKFQIHNETSDHAVYVEGGTVNISDQAVLEMKGKTTASDVPDANPNGQLEYFGFGVGVFVSQGSTLNIENATVKIEGNITSFLIGKGAGEQKSHLNLKDGTHVISKDLFNLSGVTVASVFEVYPNGVLTVSEGATIDLTGSATDPNHYAGQTYTFAIGINCIGGGDVYMNGTMNLEIKEGGTYAIMSATNYIFREGTRDIIGLINLSHITIGPKARINAKNSTSGTGVIFFAAQRYGQQSYDSDAGFGEIVPGSSIASIVIENGASLLLESVVVRNGGDRYCLSSALPTPDRLDAYTKIAIDDQRVFD